MKLVAEQIEYLRKRKKELEGKKIEYQKYCQNREQGGFDTIGTPHFMDIQEEMSNSNNRRELLEIEDMLHKSEFLVDRNYDLIDVGTIFYVQFDGIEEKERTMLVEHNTRNTSNSILFASTDSDFGSAVRGHKAGDTITYHVKATGRKMTIHIDSIDKIKDHYAHFIREKAFTKRVSETVREELKRLKEEDPKEYQKRHLITPSQEEILLEELQKISPRTTDQRLQSKRGIIKRKLKEYKVAPVPTGDRIKVGSFVELVLQDQDETIEKSFELINWAVSTETEGEYLERITPLGTAIYGLKKGDTFILKRHHKPSLKGIITNVENYEVKERVR